MTPTGGCGACRLPARVDRGERHRHCMSPGTTHRIFVGSTGLHGQAAIAFTGGLHAAFYTLTGIMALAAVLSAIRAVPRAAAGR